MKVLVTGANGLLGSNIIRELEKRSCEARAMVRSNADLLSLEGCKPDYYFGDITSGDEVNKAVAGCDYIIHTAAVTDQTLPRLDDYIKVNVEGTRNIIESCIANKVKRFIYISSTNSIGYGNKEKPGTEELPAMKPYTESFYAISKLKAEQLVLNSVNSKKINALVLNPSFMIGPYDSKPSSGKLLLVGYKEKVVFLPKGGRNFVPVEDVATAACNALKMGKIGERYLLTNSNLSYKQFFELVDEVTGFRRFKIILPSFLVKATGMIGSAVSYSGNQVLLNYNNARILTVKNFYSSEKAIGELDFPQTDIRMAVEKALRWFISKGYIKRQA